MSSTSIYKETILFLSVFILWLCFKLNYFWSMWPWGGESYLLNPWARFFLLALSFGEYPLWDPFHFWGSQEDYVILNYGQLNPFLYLTLLLYKLGCPFPTAFFIFFVVYYGFGLLGFYCLAKTVLNNTLLAFWAYCLMAFSSLGIGWFMQANIFLSLAPIFWFFYFLLQLVKTQEKKYIFGIIFASTLILTTYVPTYFIITLIAFLLACILFCFPQLKLSVVGLWQTIVKHKHVAAIGILTVCICLIPRILWYAAVQDEQYIFHVRSNPSSEKHAAAVDIEAANLGGLATEYTLPELFTDLDIGTTQFYYISLFVYLIILMSLWNKATVTLKILFFMFFSIFMYTLAGATPFHQIAFSFIPLAKYARNYYFIGPLLAGLVALFAMGHLKQLWDVKITARESKVKWISYLVFTHVLSLAYLLKEDFVIYSSHMTILLSGMAFGAIWLWPKTRHVQKIFIVLITGAILIQPLEVNYHFSRRDFTPSSPQPDHYTRPAFSYTRPAKDARYLTWGFLDLIEKDMQDLSGYAGDYYFGVKWSYFLNKNVEQQKFSEYTRYKFFLFDNVKYTDDASLDLKQFQENLSDHKNLAFVAAASDKDETREGAPAKAQVIREDSENFKVLDFRLNSIRLMTDLEAPKFLVYNDSYHRSWRAFINGKPVPLYRANVAFKGIWLPAGKNIVEFRYGPMWLPWLYTFIICYFLVFSLATLKIFINSWKRKND